MTVRNVLQRCMLLDALGVPSVFVVNSRALVAQQTEYLRRHSLQNFSVASTPQAEARAAAYIFCSCFCASVLR